MRSLLICVLLTALVQATPQSQQVVDSREPFAIELPEINSGLMEATKTIDVAIPPDKQITRLKLWLLDPYAGRVNYSGFKASLNSKSLGTVAKPLSGAHGKYLDIDLRQNPDLRLTPGKNVIEVTARESESGRTYRCSFVLLPGSNNTQKHGPDPAFAEIRCESILRPEDLNAPVSDHQAPRLTLFEPKVAINATSPGALTARVNGEASDDSGVIVSVTVNGQQIAAMPARPPVDKSKKKDKTPPPDPATIKLPFDQTLPIEPSARALLIEAKDRAGNRTLCTVPILRAAIAAAPVFGGRKFAVLVGVSWYRYNESGLGNLQFADADALAMQSWLRTAQGGDFKDEDIECLTNDKATLAAVESAVNRFLTKAGENDLIYLFLAGHGAPDPYDPQRLYFLLHDSKVTDLERTAFPMTKLGAFLEKQSKQVRLIAFFDTCHSAGIKGLPAIPTPPGKTNAKDGRGIGTKGSGAKKPGETAPTVPLRTPPAAPVTGFNFYNSELFKQKDWTVVTSSGMSELSQEGPQWNNHGVFTWALLEGVQQGKADANGDCKITSAELAAYVTSAVRRATGNAQSPQVLPGSSGEFVLAVAPNCARGK